MSSTTSPTEDSDQPPPVSLIYTRNERIPAKDFGSEVRAARDVDHLLHKAVILLDVDESSPEDIFSRLIMEIDIRAPEINPDHVKSVLFTQDECSKSSLLSHTVQSMSPVDSPNGAVDYDQTWMSALCILPTIRHRHIAIARLTRPTNMGPTMEDLRFIVLVVAPSREKGTKTSLETARTFATLMSDLDVRQKLTDAATERQFRSALLDAAKEMERHHGARVTSTIRMGKEKRRVLGSGWYPFKALKEELTNRLSFYKADFLDGIRGHRTVQKVLSTTVFLYFACLLPSIALGVLNDGNTTGAINVRKVILAQAIGGIFFALLGGQPMVILITTAPLAIYMKVIYSICEEMGYDFFAMYASVGLFCQLFLILYSAIGLSGLMRFSTRSAEEKFSLFIAIALTVESIRAAYFAFKNNYSPCKLEGGENCSRETAILFVLLMLGTVWIGMFLYNFRKTPFLTRARRELLADYALPVAVVVMSFTGSYLFSSVSNERFNLREEIPLLQIVDFSSLPLTGYVLSLVLGFSLSILFFIDQNISAAIVNNAQNRLKKGSSDNLDIFVVAVLNIFLSVLGLPWMHGGLPHSPLHVRALADIEEHVYQGHVQEVITNVRETRVATLTAHVLILLTSFFLIPQPLQYIPTAVLYGLFLYMAVTSLIGNEMFERVLLFFTEQQAYPPTHYIRRVPQRKVHIFTASQLVQLLILCAFGFAPYPFVKMVFPIVFVCFLPIRILLLPYLIENKYLEALDSRHR